MTVWKFLLFKPGYHLNINAACGKEQYNALVLEHNDDLRKDSLKFPIYQGEVVCIAINVGFSKSGYGKSIAI